MDHSHKHMKHILGMAEQGDMIGLIIKTWLDPQLSNKKFSLGGAKDFQTLLPSIQLWPCFMKQHR